MPAAVRETAPPAPPLAVPEGVPPLAVNVYDVLEPVISPAVAVRLISPPCPPLTPATLPPEVKIALVREIDAPVIATFIPERIPPVPPVNEICEFIAIVPEAVTVNTK